MPSTSLDKDNLINLQNRQEDIFTVVTFTEHTVHVRIYIS